MRKHQQEELTRGEQLMGATRAKRSRWRTLKFKRKPKKLSKHMRASPPDMMDDDESVQTEEIDRLVLSSLRFWEVERDLIEERMAAMSR
jgi:hypothetical protein